MKFWKTSKARHAGARWAVAGLMLFLWVGTFALAASPQLHALLHRDANGPNHQCLVTQLQHYQLLAGLVPPVAPPAPNALIELVCCTDSQLPPVSDYRLSPSRAPPSLAPTTAIAG